MKNRNSKVLKIKLIRIILLSLFSLILVPIQTNISHASIGDFTITSTAGSFPNFNATFGTSETLSVVVDIATSSLTMDTLTVTSSISDLSIVRTNNLYDGIFDILLPSNIDSGTYTIDFLWESDAAESSTSTVNLNVTAIAPGAPTGVSATAGNGSASISFTAGSTGGSAITDYLYSIDSGAWTSASSTTSPFSITGLTNGTTYSVEIRAVNIVDSGTVSTPITVTPAAPAPAPAPVYIPTTLQAALVLSSSATTVEWGMQTKLTLSGGSGTGKVSYSSSGSTFCAVDRDGNLTPVSAGTCTVTATKDGDGTYGSATSNAITITSVDKPVSASSSGSASNTGASMVVGKPVGGVATVKFTVADTYAGEKVSIILATKSSTGKTLYKSLGSATVSSAGSVTFKTKVKLPAGGVLQLKSAGTVILSKSIK